MFWRPVARTILESTLKCWVVAASMGLASSAQALSPDGQPELLTASIYARNSEPPKLLFRFRRTAVVAGTKLSVVREYLYPDGRVAARETVLYDGNNLLSYHLEELQIGASGTVTVQDDPKDSGRMSLNFTYAHEGDRRPHGRIAIQKAGAEVLVNDMMGAFVAANYDRLDHGAKITCRYIVVSRRETVGLSMEKQSETSYHGCEAIVLKVQPTSPLISMLVSPLYFTVEKSPPHRVLQYVGLTTPKTGETGHWKDLEALTVFDW